MSAEAYQLIDGSVFDKSILKRVLSKKNLQQGVNLKDFGTNFDLILGEKSNFYQTRNAYLQF